MNDYDPLYKIPYEPSFLQAYSNDIIYHNAVWLTAHNAFSNREDGWSYAQQSMNIEHMFLHGVRSFMLDIYKEQDGNLYLCHGGCGAPMIFQKANRQPDTLEKLLLNIHKLLNENPQDIITLHLESYASGKDVLKVLDKSGLFENLLKSKNPNDNSLTLGWMRKNDERLVVFSDYAYERKLSDHRVYYDKMGLYKGIFPSTNYKETEYDIDSFSKCEMRIFDFRAEPNDPDVHLFVFNHFSPFSALKNYNTINKFESIMTRVHICLLNGLRPNFIAVDYFEYGDCASNCISTKQVVFSLNMHKNNLQLYNVSDSSVAPKNLPTYSHAYNIYEYIVSKDLIYFTTSISIEYCMYKVGQAVENQFNNLEAVEKIAFINTGAHNFFAAAHMINQGTTLYSSCNVHSALCTAYVGYLALNAAYFIHKARPNIALG